jgi:hypothetical protein
VVNETDEAFYVRVESQWVWEVEPPSSGTANTGLGAGHKRVEILYPDCSSANAWGVGLPVTVTIRDHDVSEASAPAVTGGISVSGELVSTETCALH